MNRLSVRDDMVGTTSLAGAKYDYLPAILAVGPDGKPAAFTTPEGKRTNAMPTPRTEEEMTQVVNATPPGEGGEDEEEPSEESLYEPLTVEREPLSMSTTPLPNTPYPEVSMPSAENTGNTTRGTNARNSRVYSPIPQSLPQESIDAVSQDRAGGASKESQARSSAGSLDRIPTHPLRTQQGGGCGCSLKSQGGGGCGCRLGKQHAGGNLFQTLVAISRGAIPAAALAASAVYMTRKRRPEKRTSRGKTQRGKTQRGKTQKKGSRREREKS